MKTLFPYPSNAFPLASRRDTLSYLQAAGILLVLLAGILMVFFVSKHRNHEGTYETKFIGKKL